MTRLPGMASCRRRELDATLRAIGLPLGLCFTFLYVGLNQRHGLSFADNPLFATTAKSACLTGMIDVCLFSTYRLNRKYRNYRSDGFNFVAPCGS